MVKRDNRELEMRQYKEEFKMAKGMAIIPKIQKEEGKYFIDILKELWAQGYRNCDIAVKFDINQATINRYLKRLEELGSPELYGKYYNKSKESPNKKLDIEKIESEYKMPIREVLYTLRYKGKMNCNQIAKLFDVNSFTVQYWMKQFGIQMSISTAHKQSIETGRINYSEIHRRIRRNSTINLAKGSSKEEYVRLLMKSRLDYILPESFEYVIGFSDWSILKGKEVDIPIIIINSTTNDVYKIAVEYDGCMYHDELINEEKQRALKERNWHYLNIFDDGMNQEQLSSKINDIIRQIVNLLCAVKVVKGSVYSQKEVNKEE